MQDYLPITGIADFGGFFAGGDFTEGVVIESLECVKFRTISHFFGFKQESGSDSGFSGTFLPVNEEMWASNEFVDITLVVDVPV